MLAGKRHKKPLLERGADAIAHQIVHHNCIGCISILVVVIALSAIAFLAVPFEMVTDGTTFAIRNHPIAEEYAGAVQGVVATSFVGKEEKVVFPNAEFLTSLTLIYYNAENVFTRPVLQEIQALEKRIVAVKDFEKYCLKAPFEGSACQPPLTPIGFLTNASTGDIVDDINAALLLQQNRSAALLDSFVAPEFQPPEALTSTLTKSTFLFGAPLEGFATADDRHEEQIEAFRLWAEDNIAPIIDDYESEHLDLYSFNPELLLKEFDRILAADVTFAFVSIVFVAVYVAFHTRSLFLASFGLLHVILAFPLAYFIFRFIIQEEFFNFLNFLGLFIVLGIGADDIFILLDAWKQSAFQPREVSGSLETRMSWTYLRSSKAMFVTTLTTAVAFFANIVSSIAPIRMFGVFAGLVIICNYVLVVTLFPCVVMTWHFFFENRTYKQIFTCQCWSLDLSTPFKKDAKLAGASDDVVSSADTSAVDDDAELQEESASPSASDITGSGLDTGAESEDSEDGRPRKLLATAATSTRLERIEEYRMLERFFYGTFTNVVYKLRFAILFVFLVLFAVMMVYGVQIEPAKEPARFLPDDQPVQVTIDYLNEGFKQPAQAMTVAVVWGVKGIDRTGTDPNSPNDLGTTEWDDSFDPSSPEAQEFMVRACDLAKDEESTRNGEVLCPMEDFRDYVTNTLLEPFPVPQASFYDRLLNFTQTNPLGYIAGSLFNFGGAVFNGKDTIRFDPETGEMKMMMFVVNTTYDITVTAEVIKPTYKQWEEFVADLNAEAPAGMDQAIQIAGKWVEMQTEINLVQSSFIGFAISLSVAYVVLAVTTWSLYLATLAIICIFFVVVAILGLMVIIGWSLGIIETVCITILVGLSVDYIVHLANSYNESVETNRVERAREAVTDIGISVFSAIVTTLGSSFMLFFTTVLFFVRFGQFIFMTVAISGLAAFFLFMALVMVLGPPIGPCVKESATEEETVEDTEEAETTGSQ